MRRSYAFTLIELLVVISIIALLIAILLPTLSTARQAAQGIQCASNLRQVMIAMLSYTNDNVDSLPPSQEIVPSPNGDGVRNLAWAGRVGSQSAGYVTGPEVFFCPGRAQRRWTPNFKSMHSPQTSDYRSDAYHNHWFYIGYSANRYGAMPTNDDMNSSNPYRPVRTTQAGVPTSGLLVLAEAYNQTMLNNPAYYYDGWYRVTPATTNEPLFTHGKNTSSAYLDGHVETGAEKLGWDADNAKWRAGMNLDRANAPWYASQFTR